MNHNSFELAQKIITGAFQKKVLIAVAESLTGGLLAASLVQIAGASKVFSGAVVAYDLQVKRSLLNVSADLLEKEGAVHESVAKQMAAGVRQACAVQNGTGKLRVAELGVSTTGVAGPDPDPKTGQKAGTVWVGISSNLGNSAQLLKLTGDRNKIREQTVMMALKALKHELERL